MQARAEPARGEAGVGHARSHRGHDGREAAQVAAGHHSRRGQGQPRATTSLRACEVRRRLVGCRGGVGAEGRAGSIRPGAGARARDLNLMGKSVMASPWELPHLSLSVCGRTEARGFVSASRSCQF